MSAGTLQHEKPVVQLNDLNLWNVRKGVGLRACVFQKDPPDQTRICQRAEA